MKKILYFWVVLLFFFFTWHSFAVNIESLRNTESYVIDNAGVLKPEEKKLLETQIQEIRKNYTAETLILLIDSTSWEDISELSTKIGHELGVGKSDTDNGIVILIAINDRAWNISIWYWLEWVLPDVLVNRIGTKNFWVFWEGKYYEWISNTLSDISWIISGDPSIVSKFAENFENTQKNYEFLFFLGFIVLLISQIVFKPLVKAKKYGKVWKYILLGYLITLPIVFALVWVLAILINIFIWGAWSLVWIFAKPWEWGGFRWGGGFGWWWGRSGGFWGWGFGWGGSSWKW